MAFINGNPNSLNFVLTKEGKKLLMTKGLVNEIFYYSLWNDNFIYSLDVPPDFMPDINGSEKSKVDLINNRYEITTK